MAYSYTQISLYEKCPYAYYLRYIEKIPEPKSEALKRGIKIHGQIEDYLKGNRKTLNTIHKSSKRLVDQTKEMSPGIEELWHLNKEWELVDNWDWLVVKMDAYCVPINSVLRIIDWKTGKPWRGHLGQQNLYATAGFSVYDCKKIECINAYVDSGEIAQCSFVEEQYKQMLSLWSGRLIRLSNETDWKMTPGFHCKWCSYNRNNGGPCNYG